MKHSLFYLSLILLINAQEKIAGYELIFDTANPKIAKINASLILQDSTLQMASWGHPYLPNGWATFVKNLTVQSESGERLAYSIGDNGSWRLDQANGTKVKLTYQVHFSHDQYDWDPAGGIDARPEVRDGVYFLISKALFIYSPGTEKSRIKFTIPKQWQIASSWYEIGPNEFTTDSWISLVNNALVLGNFKRQVIQNGSMQLILAIDNQLQRHADTFIRILRKQLNEFSRLFHGTPAKNYLINIRLEAIDDGESFNDSFTQVITDQRIDDRYIIWANTMGHEMFHYWNGNNFFVGKDEAKLYWFTEGFTEYYSSLSLLRTAVINESTYLKKLGHYISRYMITKKLWPLEQISLETAGYEKGKNWLFIYGGGALMALSLDIEIRSQTANKKSLDDVMLFLKEKFGDHQQRIDTDDIRNAVNKVSGVDFTDFFARYISGKSDYLNYQQILDKAGLYVDQFADETYLSKKSDQSILFNSMISAQE
ncbi:MAG: hypothetical protein KDD94_04640 [Calditrichaeota bacterium]|nr:hypothetical protein [Calditrichota bacterium]